MRSPCLACTKGTSSSVYVPPLRAPERVFWSVEGNLVECAAYTASSRFREYCMSANLTHVTPEGDVRMVDVSHKPATVRVAEAAGRVSLGQEAFTALREQGLHKGDALTVAKLAGIVGAKHTSTLLPLCHQVPLSSVTVDFMLDESDHAVAIRARTTSTGPTGVEMEALTTVTVAALAIYDMCKAISKAIRIEGIHLVSKTGGRGGAYRREHIQPTY